MPSPDPRTIPSFTTQLWSEEVGIAEASEAPVADVGYRFSSGRQFVPSAYDAPVPAALLELSVQTSSAGRSDVAGSVALDAVAALAQAQSCAAT